MLGDEHVMKHILIINGHQKYPHSKGDLNHTIFQAITKKLETVYQIDTTIVDQGYDVTEEQKKFKWADSIIFQTPIYWFSVPGKFKTYFEQIYKRDLFFTGGKGYGRGGLLTDKQYMFSTTWGAPEEAFLNESEFFDGKAIDDVLLPLHKTQEFVGMKQLKTFSVHKVKTPDIKAYLQKLDKHLDDVFDLS